MFYYLEGTVAHIAHQLAVIDCGGVGYQCYTTNYTLATLEKGRKGKLYTHLSVKEDSMTIFGFAGESELRCFELLISVSGVGPKAALSVLSTVTPDQLALAVVAEDANVLTMAQGIGKKIAQRIILELKDKLSKAQQVTGGESYGGGSATTITPNKISEATAALAVLGYTPGEATMALRNIDVESLSLEEIIRTALKTMMK